MELEAVEYNKHLHFPFHFHQKYKRGDGETHELFFNLIEHLLEYEPDRRLSAKEAICHPFFYGMMIHTSANRHSHSKSR